MAIDIGIVRDDAHAALANAAIQQWASYISDQPLCGSNNRLADKGLSTEPNIAGSLVPDSADIGVETDILLRIITDGVKDLLTIRDRGVGRL